MNNYSYYILYVSLLFQYLQSLQEEFFDIFFQLKLVGKIYSFFGLQKIMVFVQEGCWVFSKQRINDIIKKYYFLIYFILVLYYSLILVFFQDF